jgi:type IV secretory pathway protease TraF
MKPVVAVAGDAVCRLGLSLWINSRRSVLVPIADRLGRPLLAWSGCRRLNAGEVFLLSSARGSYDSRYFGPVDDRLVVGVVVPIWTAPFY